MAGTLTNIEKYHQGIPLTPENEALRDWQMLEPVAEAKPAVSGPKPDVIDRELKKVERLDLKECMEMPGWDIFLRLMQKADRTHEKSAISMSQNDPLANARRIAEEWAYLQMFRRAVAEVVMLAKAEVAALEKEQEAAQQKKAAKKKAG